MIIPIFEKLSVTTGELFFYKKNMLFEREPLFLCGLMIILEIP